MQFESVEFQVPAHWLSAIINGDETSFDYYDDDLDHQAYLAFCKYEVKDAMVEVVEEESFFSSYHDARGYSVLPCDVFECVFHYPIVDNN